MVFLFNLRSKISAGSMRLSTGMILNVIVLSISAQAASSVECFRSAEKRLKNSPAFRVTCSAKSDCEFAPSTGMNASSMAVINSVAVKLKSCWQKSGLTAIQNIKGPPGAKLLILRYTARLQSKDPTICTIAELKPFGSKALTTSFRAQCKVKQ